MSDNENLMRMMRDLLSEQRNPSAGNASNNANDTRNYRERMDDLIKSSKDAGDSFKRLNGGIKLTNRAQYEHRVALQEAQGELYDLEVALRKHRKGTDLLTDTQLKAVEARRKELSGMMQQGQGMEKFTAGVEKWGKFLIGYYGAVQQATLQGIGQVLSTVQSGGSGFAIANAQMAMNLDIANVHTQQMAQATQMAGASIAMIPGFASKILGVGLALGAEAKKVSSQLQTDAKKMFNNLLMAGGDQLLKAYEGLTKGGVLLAGGANSIQKALTVDGKMRITFQTFERMVQASAGLLADSNIGVGKAAAMMGNIAARLKASGVDKAFQALGIDLEETGPIIAQVMKDFARSGRKLTEGDTPEVQQRTIEYAKNLALLSQLSGKSVKEEMAKRSAAQSEFGYRAKMAQLGERANKEQAQVMEGLTGNTRAAIVELERFGFIKNEDVRNMAQLIPEFGEYLNDMAREFGAGNLSIGRELQLRQKMGPALQNSLKNNPLLADLAVARTKLEAPLNAFMEEYDRTMRSSAETVKETMAIINERYASGLKAQLGGAGGLDDTLLFMKSIGEEFSAKFQENIIGRIVQIGGLLKSALEQAESLLKSGPQVNTGPLDAVSIDKWIPILATIMGLELARKVVQGLRGNKTPTTTTTETSGTETAPQEKSRMERTKDWFKEKTGMGKTPTGSALDIARMEQGLGGGATVEEIQAAKAAKFSAKYGKYIKGLGWVSVGAQGFENVNNSLNIRKEQKEGKITEKEANARVTGEAFDFVGALGSAGLGGKIGAGVGFAVGSMFFGVGAPFGALIGGILGSIAGALTYYLTPLQTWTKEFGKYTSKLWQEFSFTNMWSSIGKALNSSMTEVTDKIKSWADSGYKSVTSWFNFGDTPKPAPSASSQSSSSSAPPAVPVATQVATQLPPGLKMYVGGLGVSLMAGGNFVTLDAQGKSAFTEVFTNALKNSIGGAGALGTTNYSTGFYKPKLDPKGKPVTEADFAEIGKGDPVVYALGKLTQIAAESATDMRSLALKMGASLDTAGDSKRYLRNMSQAFR
jgi:hypothetical protein